MGILDRLGGWLRMERRSALMRHDSWASERWGEPSLSGVTVTADSAMRQVSVYASVRLLAETVASLPCHVYRRKKSGGKERASEHPLSGLLQAPNPLMTRAEVIEALMASLTLRGPGYGRIVWNNAGQVQEIAPVHPDRVQRKPGKDGRSFVYAIDGGAEVVPHHEMWHPRGFSVDGLNAISPISYHRETIGLALAAEEHGAAFLGNAARPSGILSHPGQLKEQARANLVKSWSTAHSGKKVGGVAVLEEGLTWTPLTMSAEDLQYIETRKMQRTEIAALFRVPPHKIGDLERATFSNIEHQSIEFVTDSIRPWLVKLEQSALRDLFLPKERSEFFLEFSVDGLLRGDTLSRYQAHNIALTGGWKSPNEIREIENLNPRKGGDVYLTPLNMASSDATQQEGAPDED